MTDLSPNSLNANLKIVKTEIKPSGEAIQVVRPLVSSAKTTDQIVGELVNRFDYRSGEVKASENELNTVQQAFGSNLANELIKTYEGSNLVSDSQQDLVGDKYLAEQIRMIQEQQKTTSILDKWGHLLYEGERDYKSAVSTGSKTSLTGGQSIGNGTSNCNSGSGGYATTYSNGSIAHYNQLIEEHNKKLQQQQQQEEQEQQQQPDMIQQYQDQLQQEQQDLQEQQEAAIQQAVAAVQQQEAAAAAVQSALRSSQSGNLAASNSNHRLLAAVNSQNAMASYAQSQSGLQSRTLSEVRLQAQLRAQLEAQAQARAQAQLQAQLQAQAQAQAQALAHARAVEQVRQQQQQQTCAQQLNRSMSGIGASSEVRSAIGVSAAPVQSHSQHSLHQQQQQLQHQQSHQSLSQQQNQQQQPQPFLPQLSSNNLKSVTLEAYNSPQFKAMLEQLSKPISVPPEQINYPPEWPSQDKISEYLLAEPIYIPAPQPIVIPAPNIITIESQPLDAPTFSRHDLPDAAVKPTVTYYPSISTDQAHMKNFGIRQLNLDTNLNRTASVINQAQQQQHQY